MATATAVPSGGTWFDTLKKSFVDVPVDSSNNNAIATKSFLDAAESLTTLFGGQTPAFVLHSELFYNSTHSFLDLLGSVAFTPVKNDLLGNIKV